MTEDEFSKAIKSLKNRKQYIDAENLAIDALQLYPDNAKIFCGLADVYLKWGKVDMAEQRYAEAVKMFPDNAVARNGWAQTALVRGDLPTAEQRYAEAVKMFPDNAVARNGWAQTALVRGDLPTAEQRYAEAVKMFPNDAVARTSWAQTALVRGDLPTAEQRYAEAVKMFPNDAVARTSWAQTALVRGDLPTAEQRYAEAVKMFPDNAVARNGWAQTALVRGDLPTAEERCNEAIKINAENPIANLFLCVIDIRNALNSDMPGRQYQSALKRAQKILEVNFHPTPLRVLKSLAELGFQETYYLTLLDMAVIQGEMTIFEKKSKWLPDPSLAPENAVSRMTHDVLGYAQSRFFNDPRVLQPINGAAASITGWTYSRELRKWCPPKDFPTSPVAAP